MKKVISFVLVAVMFVMMAGMSDNTANNAFADVSSEDECYEAIQKCVELGIVNGNGAGYFYPSNYVTYAQLVAMELRFLKIEVDASDYINYWCEPYMILAHELGLIRDIDSSTLEPIPNYLIAGLVSYLFEYLDIRLNTKIYTEAESSELYPETFKKAIGECYSLHLFDKEADNELGDENDEEVNKKFNANAFMTRAEACEMFCKLNNLLENRDYYFSGVTLAEFDEFFALDFSNFDAKAEELAEAETSNDYEKKIKAEKMKKILITMAFDKVAYRYYVIENDWSPEAAYTVISYYHEESHLDNRAYNYSSGATGLGQRLYNRWSKVVSWANENGYEPWSYEAQVRAMIESPDRGCMIEEYAYKYDEFTHCNEKVEAIYTFSYWWAGGNPPIWNEYDNVKNVIENGAMYEGWMGYGM